MSKSIEEFTYLFNQLDNYDRNIVIHEAIGSMSYMLKSRKYREYEAAEQVHSLISFKKEGANNETL